MLTGNQLNPLCESLAEGRICGFAPEAIEFILEKTNLNKGMILADIESGSGILASHFLKDANTVYCVEKDKDNRQKAAEKFWKNKNFREVNGDFGNTRLCSKSVDIITCRWNIPGTEQFESISEFRRILKEDGWLVIILNRISEKTIPEKYEKEILKEFYPMGKWEKMVFPFTLKADVCSFSELALREDFGHFPDTTEDDFSSDSKGTGLSRQSASTVVYIGQPGY